MAATILETIAAYAKERAAKDKENVPEAVMKERALARKAHSDSVKH